MSHANGKRCATCTHWTGNRADPKVGQCRRFPPQPAGHIMMQNLANEQQPAVLWGECPETSASFWCGEWREAEEKRVMAS